MTKQSSEICDMCGTQLGNEYWDINYHNIEQRWHEESLSILCEDCWREITRLIFDEGRKSKALRDDPCNSCDHQNADCTGQCRSDE